MADAPGLHHGDQHAGVLQGFADGPFVSAGGFQDNMHAALRCLALQPLDELAMSAHRVVELAEELVARCQVQRPFGNIDAEVN